MPSPAVGFSPAPLADYFWIAGVDGMEILEVFQKLGDEYRASQAAAAAAAVNGPALTDTIEEDADAEEEERSARLEVTPSSSRRASSIPQQLQQQQQQHLPRASLNYQRLSFRSNDSDPTIHSNRSSMTMKRAISPTTGTTGPGAGTGGGDDFDFDKALVKFASEREHFLTDLSLSAGAITSPPTKSKYRAQKIVPEEAPAQPASTNLLRSSIGSVRRRMSFREMSSMKRQASLVRHGMALFPPFLSFYIQRPADSAFRLRSRIPPPK